MRGEDYVVVWPKRIKKQVSEFSAPKKGEYLVKTRFLQVCDADAKYYFGLRPRFPFALFGFRFFYGIRKRKEFMKKYPIILIHEAIGVIEQPGPGTSLKKGQRVVFIPSQPCYLHGGHSDCVYCRKGGLGEQFCRESKFMSSNMPGFLRSCMILPEVCVVPIPDDVPDDVAISCELSSVAYNALENSLKKDDFVLIFGDGYLAFVLALMASYAFKIPKNRLFVVGKSQEKLSRFSSFASTALFNEELPKGATIVFDCVGMTAAEDIINKAIDLLSPFGRIVLLGVSEERVPVNTRDVLSKSITIRGFSRSPASSYAKVLKVFRSSSVQKLLKPLTAEKKRLSSIADLENAFEEYMVNRKKLLLEFS